MLSREDRFWAKVEKKPNGCWDWTASCFWDGYGMFRWEGHPSGRAHRYSYELHRGRIPDGKIIDHLCRNRKCVNPDHLEVVTNRENIMRGEGPEKIADFHRSKTHCPHGHEFTEENTYMAKEQKKCVRQRQCRTCTRLRMQRFRQQRTLQRMKRGVEGSHVV